MAEGSNLLQSVRRNELYRQANSIGVAAQGLGLFEKRLIILALAGLDHKSDHPSLEAIIPISAFAEHGIENPYHRVSEAASALGTRQIHIPLEGGGFEQFGWITYAKYRPSNKHNELGFPYVHLIFNEKLRPWITNLRSHYAILPIQDVIQMPSSFSARLYEVLWHLSMAGKRSEVVLELREFRVALDLFKRDKDQRLTDEELYKEWRDLRKQLLIALKVFDEYGRLKVDFEGIRVGRKIGKIRFTVRVTKDIPHLRIHVPEVYADSLVEGQGLLRQRLQAVGFTGNVTKLLDEHAEAAVEAAVAITERKQREGALRSPGGFLRTILKDGTAQAEAERQIVDTQKTTDAEPVDEEDQLVAAWEQHRHSLANQIMATHDLKTPEVKSLTQELVDSLPGSKFIRQHLEKDDWQGVLYEMYRTRAICERYRDELPPTAHNLDDFRIMHLGMTN